MAAAEAAMAAYEDQTRAANDALQAMMDTTLAMFDADLALEAQIARTEDTLFEYAEALAARVGLVRQRLATDADETAVAQLIDATSAGIGARNKALYKKHGKKAVFQAGEKNDVADVFFHGYANYEKGVGATFLKLTSCNTTGFVRAIDCLDREVGGGGHQGCLDPHEQGDARSAGAGGRE